ncbi:hypothetical protein MSIMFI_04925 [Mycobacterium simulans]|uniref:helix-turn-helix transcriptional regulator n=1 Tax=Mycobacterium simulans TaxID=627089 RepID=UPI00174E3CC8|nr:helix-turn-helix domain-containing protein [Mycobacterium simulans]SON63395.1 hypothetical protein MSIMFI_04925 [Mycobacterium simulans]
MNDLATDTAGTAVLAREAAPRLRVTEQTLKRWRARGIGPAYVRLENGQVRYRIADLEAWLQQHAVTPGSSSPQRD